MSCFKEEGYHTSSGVNLCGRQYEKNLIALLEPRAPAHVQSLVDRWRKVGPVLQSFPFPKPLVIWGASPVTLTVTQIAKVIRQEDAHITRVLGMWMPKTRDAHITMTLARRVTLLSKRANLARQVTLLSEPTFVSHVNFNSKDLRGF